MFIVGRTEEGSSNVPTRTAVTSGLADEFANRGDPHLGQKRCRILLPLSAVLANSLNCPEISIAAVGTSKFTMPLADMCWQSRHQQTLVASGSAERRKRTAPQRQCPVLSVMWPLTLNCLTRGSVRVGAHRYSHHSRPVLRAGRRRDSWIEARMNISSRFNRRLDCSESPARCSKRSACVRWWGLD
jgi:hypothetical protein